MTHNLKDNKSIRYSGLALLLFVFVFVSIGAISPTKVEQKSVTQTAISNYIYAQKNPNLSDENKIKAAIDAYFTTRYEGQKLLEQQNFSTVLENNTMGWVGKEKDKREIELYIATLFGLKYQSYKYTLDYDSIAIKNNKAIVQLRESHKVVFEVIAPIVSELANLEHTITLHSKNGAWVIYKDEYKDELSSQMEQMTKEEIKEKVDKSYQEDLKRKSSKLDLGLKALAMPLPQPLNLINKGYSRTAARDYANANATITGLHYRRDPNGADCTNFVSQAIYAGQAKTPPDASGMQPSNSRNWNTDWYYDFDSYTDTIPPRPLSDSASWAWITVQKQYDFITLNNTKTSKTAKIGPRGQENTLCATKVGDVIQLQGVHTAGVWDHEGIVVSSTYPYCGSLSTYLVDAHTADRLNYPLSNWASYPMRSLLILGWWGN